VLCAHAAVAAGLFARCAELLDVATAEQFDFGAFVPLDRQLHGSIVDLAGNGVLSEMYRRTIARMWIGRIYYAGREESFRRSQVSHGEHAAIVGALAAGDGAALAAALRVHTQSSLGHTLGVLARYPQAPNRQRRPQQGVVREAAARLD
jgi:DNA-binding GntR family transcriptional regulator